MAEGELPGVEHLAGEISCAFAGVEFISQDRVAEVMEVDADLVGAAAVQRAFDQAHVAARTNYSIFGFRRSSLAARDAHALPVDGVALDGFVDHASGLSRSASHERQINFAHRARGKLFRKIAVGHVVFGNDESAAGFLVEPMDDARAFLSADPGQILAVSQERVDQGVLLMTRSRMHDEAGRFVDHKEIVVLEQDFERDGLGLRIALFDLGFAHFDGVAGADGITRPRGLSIHGHEPVTNQSLEPGAGEGRERLGEGTVEPFAGLFTRNG